MVRKRIVEIVSQYVCPMTPPPSLSIRWMKEGTKVWLMNFAQVTCSRWGASVILGIRNRFWVYYFTGKDGLAKAKDAFDEALRKLQLRRDLRECCIQQWFIVQYFIYVVNGKSFLSSPPIYLPLMVVAFFKVCAMYYVVDIILELVKQRLLLTSNK